jgi:hypothetical protein
MEQQAQERLEIAFVSKQGRQVRRAHKEGTWDNQGICSVSIAYEIEEKAYSSSLMAFLSVLPRIDPLGDALPAST